MKLASLTAALLALGLAAASHAEPAAEKEAKQAAKRLDAEAAPPVAGTAPQMSEIPVMKQQGERMAVLMEQLTKESDPEVRRRIMAEAMCPQ